MRAYSKNEGLISFRRAHIAKCAARVFVKKGYSNTNTRDISEACDMSIGSLYRYVGSKEDILCLVIDLGIQREMAFRKKAFSKSKSLDPVEALKQAMGELIKSVDEIQDLIMFSYRSMQNVEPSARQNIINVDRDIVTEFEKLLIRGCKKGVFEIEHPQMIAQTIIVIAQMWAIRRWAFQKLCTLNEYIDIYTSYILKLICAETPPR